MLQFQDRRAAVRFRGQVFQPCVLRAAVQVHLHENWDSKPFPFPMDPPKPLEMSGPVVANLSLGLGMSLVSLFRPKADDMPPAQQVTEEKPRSRLDQTTKDPPDQFVIHRSPGTPPCEAKQTNP